MNTGAGIQLKIELINLNYEILCENREEKILIKRKILEREKERGWHRNFYIQGIPFSSLSP